MQDIYSFPLEKLRDTLTQNTLSANHAKSIFHALYRSESVQDALASLPRKVGGFVEAYFRRPELSVVRSGQSDDGSIKLVLKLEDGKEIETVIIKESKRTTLCVSTQVGCAQACCFCATGRMGLLRNLTAGEIVGQFVVAQKYVREASPSGIEDPISNVVFMGMGEPLDNVSEVIDATRIFTDSHGISIAPRRITISTAGHAEGLQKLIDSRLKVSLAFSLHHPRDRERSKILPINRRFPLGLVVEKLGQYNRVSGKEVFVQYTMIKNVNDGLEEAREIAVLLSGLKAKVNLIPLNPVKGSRLQAPSTESIREFQSVLADHSLKSFIRFSKGPDISAACGQLVK